MTKLVTSEYAFAFLFVLVVSAEVATIFNQLVGVSLHLITVFIATSYVIFLKKNIYVISLSLPSILRLLNLSMPVFFPYTIYWFPLVYLPIFPSAYLVVNVLNLTVEDIGLNLKKLQIYIPAGVLIGCILALIEFRILKTESLIPDFSIGSIVALFVIMFLFVSLTEELIFRSVLQSSLEKEFGMLSGLILATAIFAIMHMQGGFLETIFIFFAGILIGYLFQKTRSLIFITVIHGTVNVMIFGLFHMI